MSAPVSHIALHLYAELLRRRADDCDLAVQRCRANGKNQAAAVLDRRAQDFRRFAHRAELEAARGVGQSPTVNVVAVSSANAVAPVGQGVQA